MLLRCSTKARGSMDLNRPERSRSARITEAIWVATCAWAGSPEARSEIAIGRGWMLAWVTSTCSAAFAGKGRSAARTKPKPRSNFLMPFSKDICGNLVPEADLFWASLIHHLARIEPERAD